MTYPGNPSLAADVQQRIFTTFRQSVQSAGQGNKDEALLGCDFVLRLDPQFAPARKLQQMLSSGSAPEEFAALLTGLEGNGGSGEPADGLRASFAEMLAERRFAEILNAAERDKRQVSADPELRALVEQAQSRFEADPYVIKFAESAELAIRSGESENAGSLVEKARSLDPTHPRVAELDQMLEHYGDPSRAMGGRRRGVTFDEMDQPTGGEEPDPSLAPPADLDLGFDLPDAAEAGFAGAGGDSGGDGERVPEETSGRIVELLGEGQAAFERGEYQSAIDAWSRIFLIDIDHEEAARKIEQARQLKSEREREVEEIFHDGVGKFDSGDLPGSREAFQKVLELQPSYALAREYLDKLEEREAGIELPGGGLPELAPIEDVPAPGGGTVEMPEPSEMELDAAAAPERLGGRRAVGTGYAATAKRSAISLPSPRFLAIGGGMLVLLAIVGWVLFTQREKLFPNAQAPVAVATEKSPIDRARELHDRGQTAMAVAQLRRVTSLEPDYAEAQSLISQWEKLAGSSEEEAGDQVEVARRRALLESAQQALSQGENFQARRLFERAAEIAPLDGDWVAMAASAETQLESLDSELEMFKDGEYEYLLSQLWRRREAEPSNRDVARMIADSYFNLGVLDLQRGDPVAAREKFREARGIDATDPMLQRLERFAASYEKRSQDLLYRIFVKYIPSR